jgi:phenylalanyl-tRNA synthetase beta chain
VPANEQGGELPVQKTKLTLVADGDFRDLRGVIEGLIGNIDKDADVVFTPADLIWAQTAAVITLNAQTIGAAGVVSSSVRQRLDLKDVPACVAEIEFDSLLSLAAGPVTVKPIPRFPAIQRDLSLIVDERVRWADILEAVSAKAPPELENVQFVGIYRGKGIPSGSKSVTLTLRFRDEDGTLTHETVDGFEADIVQELAESISAELRTA